MDAGDVSLADSEAANLCKRELGQRLDSRDRAGALYRNQRGLLALVAEVGARRAESQQPVAIGRDIRCVDAQHEAFGAEPIDDQVVDGAAVLRAHDRVLGAPLGQGRGGVGHRALEYRGGVGTTQLEFAHVTQIEDPGGGADRKMLLDNAGIADRHFETTENRHPGAEFLVQGEERGALERVHLIKF